jgi:hypothetical protein
MGICHDVEEGLEKYEITKIDGQPTDEDLNLLAKEYPMPLAASQLKMGAKSMATLEWLSKKPNTSPFPGMATGFWPLQTPDHTQ